MPYPALPLEPAFPCHLTLVILVSGWVAVRDHSWDPLHLRRNTGERAVAHPGNVPSEPIGELHRPVEGGGHVHRHPGSQRHHTGEGDAGYMLYARLFTLPYPTRGPGQEVLKYHGSGRVKRVSKSHGSGLVTTTRPDLTRGLARPVNSPCYMCTLDGNVRNCCTHRDAS